LVAAPLSVTTKSLLPCKLKGCQMVAGGKAANPRKVAANQFDPELPNASGPWLLFVPHPARPTD